MEKFKEMVEAKLNGESAKDLVSGIKIIETKVGDFFRAAKAGYDSYKRIQKDLGHLKRDYKSARKAVSSGGSANLVVNKNKGKDSTNSFSTSGTFAVETPMPLRTSDKLSGLYKKFNLSPNLPTSSADITNVNRRYAQVTALDNAMSDAMHDMADRLSLSDWDRYQRKTSPQRRDERSNG